MLTTPTVARLRRVVYADGLMMRPDGAGRLMLHGDAQDAHVRADTRCRRRRRSRTSWSSWPVRCCGTETARVESATIGIRALPADRLPVVGPARDGLYVVATHSGITLAPLLGELVAGELMDERQRTRWSAFDRRASRGR